MGRLDQLGSARGRFCYDSVTSLASFSFRIYLCPPVDVRVSELVPDERFVPCTKTGQGGNGL